MSLFKPGILENISFSLESDLNDKGTLNLVMEVAAGKESLMAAMESNEAYDTMKQGFLFFPPNPVDYDKNQKSSADIASEFTKMRTVLLNYGYLIAPKEEAQEAYGGLEMFRGLGIAEDEIPNLLENLDKKEVIEKVYKNLVTKFLAFVKSKSEFTTTPFRHKFWRKNKKENYAIIPNNVYDVMVEPMTVPKEASAIAWSEWEIKNKKNDPNPAAPDAKTVTESGSDLFSPQGTVTDEDGLFSGKGVDEII